MLRNVMKLSIGALILVMAVSGCYVVDPWNDHNGDEEARADFSFELSLGNRSRFYLDGINGPVKLVGVADADKIEIWGVRIVRSDTEADAIEALEDLEVHVVESGSSVAVETEQPSHSHGREYRVDYFIRVPAHWLVNIDLVNGTVHADSLTGDLEVDLTNGNLMFNEVHCDVTCDVTNGNIEGILDFPAGGSCELDVTNGEIDLTLPADISANFTAGVVNGSVAVTGMDLTGFTVNNRQVNGVLGSGNGRVDLDVVNGRIRVSGR